ncbi:MAG: LD-carboxypeptidase [Hyphomicrobiales bacterium]
MSNISNQCIKPSSLNEGDYIGLVAPAGRINQMTVDNGIQMVKDMGFNYKLGKNVLNSKGRFSATDEERASDMQAMIDDPDVRAILALRGGYGSVRIIDRINFAAFAKDPKWIIGFSDITVFHSHLQKNYNTQTIHAAMPVSYQENKKEAGVIEGIKSILIGDNVSYEFESHDLNREGEASGVLCGGNLTLFHSLLASDSDLNTDGKILMFEDLCEEMYKIDRYLMSLKRAGKFDKIKGLVIGQFTNLTDSNPPLGKTIEELFVDITKEYDFPVMFDFPVGHTHNNLPLALGQSYSLKVEKENSYLFPNNR